MGEILQQIVYGTTVGSVYALIALGFSMIFRTAGLLNFAHQEFMMVGGLLGYTLLARLHLPFLVAVAGVLLGCAVASLGLERLGIAPIRRRGGTVMNMVVATIGWSIVITNASMLVWGAYSLSYPQANLARPLRVAGVSLTVQHLWILGVGFGMMILLQLLLKRTRLGLAMRAAAEDPATAEVMGIPIDRVIALTFALSGGLAGVAGILIGSLYYASFEMGILGLKSLSAAVLGGFGSLPGAMLGGLLLGVLETLGAVYIKSEYNDIIVYGLLVLILLARPTGILGETRREV